MGNTFAYLVGVYLCALRSLLCLGLLLRKQWMEREKLSFPLTQLPLQITTNRSFFRARALWLGLELRHCCAYLQVYTTFSPYQYPALPANYRLDRHFTEKPWSAIGYASMSFNLAIVGLTYFMPLDLAFSTWFFFWLTRAERVIASMLGISNMSVLHFNDRAAGAWVGIAVLTVWMGRRHLARFFRHLLGREKGDDINEPFSYRTVAVLTILSVGLVCVFCYAAGMSLMGYSCFLRVVYRVCSGNRASPSGNWDRLTTKLSALIRVK